MRALAALLCAALLLGAEPQPSAAPSSAVVFPAMQATDPYFILQRAREVFHAHVRPPYITYNMRRVVWIDDQPDGDDGYELRIWCRTADAVALARIWNPFRKRAMYELHFLPFTLRLDTDPGPPIGDIFERPPPAPPRAPHPGATERLRTIAIVANKGDLDYRASYSGIEKGAYHLKLQPLRDEQRNRLRELWVDSQFEVVRAIEVNRPVQLYDAWSPAPQDVVSDGPLVPIRLDMKFATVEGIPVLQQAKELTEVIPSFGTGGHRIEMEFHYDRVVFATTLPDWYFDPKTYHERFREAPSY